MEKELNDFQTLELVIGGQKLRDMSAFGFLQWMANKLTGIKAFSSDAVELTSLIRVPPMSQHMSPEKKIEIIRKMIKLGIKIP